MTGSTNSERLAQREADVRFHEALVVHGEFRYGITVVNESGSVELSQQWVTQPYASNVIRVRIVADGVSPAAFRGLRVVPVDDESGHQVTQRMGNNGEVDFDLCVHSVRFSTA